MSTTNVPECCICMDSINSAINNCTTPCGHMFCFQCLAKALEQNNTCPMCRAVLMEVPDEEETLYTDEDEYEMDSDDESVEQFDDDALRAFRGFMQRVESTIASISEPAEAMEVEDSKEEHAEDLEEEEEEEEDNTTTENVVEADVETITETLQKRGITMLDLVALLTDRPSTKIAKHTDRFMNALETILDKAIDDCDREAAQSQA